MMARSLLTDVDGPVGVTCVINSEPGADIIVM